MIIIISKFPSPLILIFNSSHLQFSDFHLEKYSSIVTKTRETIDFYQKIKVT